MDAPASQVRQFHSDSRSLSTGLCIGTGNTNINAVFTRPSREEEAMLRLCSRVLLALCAVVAAVLLIVSSADARPRFSAGSRGSQTFSAPPSTATSPSARPIERSMTQPGTRTFGQRPMSAPSGGFFGRPGFLGGLFAGFLGAGLLGMLFGYGFAGGLGGIASLFGLMLQIGLIAAIGYLLWNWWQRRSQPALAGAPLMRDLSSGYPGARPTYGVGGGGAAVAARTPGADEVGLTPEDFNTFERLLGEIQTGYGAEDLNCLRARVTPEMLSYFAEELAANASKGVVNRISDVKLLQGDLAEAWREGDTDYATVAMRYSLTDRMVERDRARVLEGGADEATEVWTFMRKRGGQWLLSAIQQT
jgi:predicted lipid-binding transport protein (Tim44 family)